MLGAWIDVVEAPIRNFQAYLLALPDTKKRQQLWLNEIKRADKNASKKGSQHTLLIRKG